MNKRELQNWRGSRLIITAVIFILIITTAIAFPVNADAVTNKKGVFARVEAYPIISYSLGNTVVYELDDMLTSTSNSGRYYKITVDKKMDVEFFVAAEWDDTLAGLYDSNFEAVWNVTGDGSEGYTFTKPWNYDSSQNTYKNYYSTTTTLTKGVYYIGFANLDSTYFVNSWVGLSTTIKKTYPVTKPAKMSVKKIKPAKKKMTVSWTKHKDSDIKKYQVRYKVKGTKKWKTKNVATSKKSIVIKKLKKGKKYSVQIRAYKLDGTKKVYGSWSKTKTSKRIK